MRILLINGKPAQIGQEVTSFRGEKAILKGWQEPRHPGSSGRVYVQEEGSDSWCEYYPGVYGGEFEKEA